MRGLQSVLSLFRKRFNKFNKTGVGMLDSLTYDSKINQKAPCMNTLRFCHYLYAKLMRC